VNQSDAPDAARVPASPGALGLGGEHHGAHEQADADQQHEYLWRHGEAVVGELHGAEMAGHGGIDGHQDQNAQASEHHRHRQAQGAVDVFAKPGWRRARRDVGFGMGHGPSCFAAAVVVRVVAGHPAEDAAY
jgi:hypothetical protein